MKARIIVDPKIMIGKPIIEGTRITVEFVLELIEQGETIEQIAKEYDLTTDQVKAAVNYAKKGIEENYPAQTAIAHEIFVRRKHK